MTSSVSEHCPEGWKYDLHLVYLRFQSRPFECFRDLFDSLPKSEPLERLSLAASCEGHIPCLHSG